MSVEVLAFLELVDAAAIRALGLAAVGHVKIDLGVTVPEFHVCQRARAEHATLMVQVFGRQLNYGLAHEDTFVSQCEYFGLRPLTMSKNALWIFSVIGPREPQPSSIRSSSRIGVTSAAVPVKKASSLM